MTPHSPSTKDPANGPAGGSANSRGSAGDRAGIPDGHPAAAPASVEDPAGHSTGSRLLLVAVALAQFMVVLDMTIVNVALPAMDDALGFGTSLPWVVNIYALTFGGCLLLGGRAADVLGRRPLLLGGTVLFALASLAGGLATEPWQLIAARALQGFGAAALAPASLALLVTVFTAPAVRARALGVYALVSALGGSGGVLLGGLLTEYAGWRWVMLVNLPMAGVVVFLMSSRSALALGASKRTGPRGRLDAPGAILATSGTGLLILGVVRTEELAWTSAETLVTLAAALVLLTAFVLWERRAKEPLLRPGLVTRPAVARANLFMLLLSAGQFAAFYFISRYLQEVLGFSAIEAGLAFLPMCVAVLGTVRLSTRLLPAVGVAPVLAAGGLLTAGGLGWFALLSASGGFTTDVLGPSLLVGLGLGCSFVPVTSAATGGLPPEEAGAASAVLNAARQIGGAVGLAVLATVQTRRTDTLLTDGRPPAEAGTGGYALGLAVAAALLIVATLVALTLPRRTEDGAADAGDGAEESPDTSNRPAAAPSHGAAPTTGEASAG